MKYIVILGDGMADYPVPQLGNKTPLQYAKKPNMDYMASHGIMGLVKTIPEGLAPGSDVANLSVMGYDPCKYYTGRSPLEAISMGIDLGANDVAFRCNLVTLSDENDYSEKCMIDYSSDEISTEESAQLIETLNDQLELPDINFYPGVSYRHCMVWRNAPHDYILTPPHDISGKKIKEYLPKGKDAGILLQLMQKSYEILKPHEVNIDRVKRGLRPANSIWFWGDGTKPSLPSFYEKYHLKGSVISAVDLVKGLGICIGLKPVNVEGATGNFNTNYKGKAEAALEELKSGQDFVYIHVEAPDECGHRYEIENKVSSIELIDRHIVGRLLKGLEEIGEYKILLLPDHPTPLSVRTHTAEPVPFIIYSPHSMQNLLLNTTGNIIQHTHASSYDEIEAKKSGIFIESGHSLMDLFIKG
ncbi:MAG TPA: cofactor-independent phosphoglycerate mutase [Clostridiaceae bacterium]|nr:cofactor-independent phosphoglycerate mutase [Clostridiaceae bacterium]